MVTVVNPAHPLYGQTLPLIGVTNKQYIGRACVVWIQPGVERLIPLWATSLADVTLPAFPCRVSVAALRALLTVGAAIAELEAADAAELEVPHEHPDPEDDPDSPHAAPTCSCPCQTTGLPTHRRCWCFPIFPRTGSGRP